MRSAFLRRAVVRLLGPSSALSDQALTRVATLGVARDRISALGELRSRGRCPRAVRGMMSDEAPGVRRSVARLLGAGGLPEDLVPLQRAARQERCDEPRLALAAAAVPCGLGQDAGWGLWRPARLDCATVAGVRDLRASIGDAGGEHERRWRGSLSSDLVALRARAQSGDMDALQALAASGQDADLPLLLETAVHGPRRHRLAALRALGLHGSPTAVPLLSAQLRSVTHDPGYGFAARRESARAIGRIGDPALGGILWHALRVEARAHEGRPGAGLGVQFPVRVVIIEAIGESGAVRLAPRLTEYLGDHHGSAQGSLAIPAMLALWKLGAVDVLREQLQRSPDTRAANALGVLGLMGETDLVRRHLHDPRPDVRRVAGQALELSQPGASGAGALGRS